MPDWIAEVLTEWQKIGNAHRIRLFEDYRGQILSGSDTTGQPAANITPDPNAVIVEMVVSEATLDDIEADANTTVLSSEEVATDA